MSIKVFRVFNIKHKLQIIKYSLGSRLINSVPKGLKHSYEFVRWLSQQGILFRKIKSFIEFKYPIDNEQYTFLINESSSDSDVFKQIILKEEYKTIVKLISKNNIIINTIIDAGANVGYTSIYLSHFFPTAQIIAIEPNSDTFIRLKQNIEINNIRKIVLLQKGLWNKNTFLKADTKFRDAQAWSFRLEETTVKEEMLFETISIPSILKANCWNTIDFLKIGIEGGEKNLFQNKEELRWLKKVKVIAIEIHDEFKCREDIEMILKEYDFQLSYSGELTIGINKSCIK